MSNYTDRLINSDDAAKIADALYAIANTAPGKRAVPVLTSSLIAYDGEEHSFTEAVTGFNPDYMIATGDLKADEMGGYTVYIQLKSPLDQWMDGSNGVKRFSWVIGTSNKTSWSEASDEDLVRLLSLADSGSIDLQNDLGWQVGDEKIVSLSAMSNSGVGESQSAQDVSFVLMHKGLYKDFNDKEVNFVVGLKDCLSTAGYMNSSDTNSGSWNSCARRTWCNGTFYNSLPSTFRTIFKQFKTITAQTYNGSTNQTSLDYFALPAAKEVFGGTVSSAGANTTFYSNLTEFNSLFQFDYYKTSANRVKHLGVSGPACRWYERSPCFTDSTLFSCGGINGPDATNASNVSGIAPFGCI